MELETLQIVLNNFVKQYRNNPINFFYEEDIRADLLIKLCTEKIFQIDLPIVKENEWIKDYIEIYGDKKEICGIKAEYPSNKRFDIAFINPAKIDNVNCYNHYIFECLFAIEIKLSQKDSKNSGFKLDIEKLKEYSKLHPGFTGIAINFEQNPNWKKNLILNNYRNYNNLIIEELNENIKLEKGAVNYFFVSPKYILGGTLD